MQWRRPHHTRWLMACVVGLVLASLIAGFNLALAVMFVIIFAVGGVVLGFDGLGVPEPEPDAGVTPSGEELLA